MKQLKLLFIIVIAIIIFAPEYSKAETTTLSTRVIFVQNGGTITNPNWNNGNTFFVSPHNNQYELNQALEIAKAHFNIFNILITTEKVVYDSFDIKHRTTIIIGSTDVLGPYTGYSLNNSYLWEDDTPGFVLVNNCNPNTLVTDIGHLIAHESGHMYGLEHDSNLASYYNAGFIMGNFTGKKYVTWASNDIRVLATVLGLKDSN